MKGTPQGWPRISSALYYDDAAKAIDWICDAFGFDVRLRVEGEGGRIEHSELEYGDGLVMVGQTNRDDRADRACCRSPRSLDGANTQSLCICVDDVDAHCARARSAGARITLEPEVHDYGAEHWADRVYEPEVGGRLFESFEDDDAETRVVETGRVTEWCPPSRLVFEWRAADFAPDEKTEVEVLFERAARGRR